MAPKRKTPVKGAEEEEDDTRSSKTQKTLDVFVTSKAKGDKPPASPKAKGDKPPASPKAKGDKPPASPKAKGDPKSLAPPKGKKDDPPPQSDAPDDGRDWISLMGESWYEALKDETKKPYFKECMTMVDAARKKSKVYPPEELVFNAFKTTPLDEIKVVIVGQDPYHQPGQAMGLCFSVNKGIKVPPSLVNIFNEIGCKSSHGDLTSWAKQGVFLLNALLTVEESKPMAHDKYGWATFTDRVIQIINEKTTGVIFLLWGKPAQKKAKAVDKKKHHVLECGHPSPLSVKHFRGCNHFKQTNVLLESSKRKAIVWDLPQ